MHHRHQELVPEGDDAHRACTIIMQPGFQTGWGRSCSLCIPGSPPTCLDHFMMGLLLVLLLACVCTCRLCLDIDNASDCKVAEQTKPKPAIDWATWKEQGEPVQCT